MSKSELSKQYQKKSDKQHVLDNPDTYIGSIEKVETTQNIFNEEDKKIFEKEILLIPGLYKLFDEGIVNCRDHWVRMKKDPENNQVSEIKVEIEDNIISLTNDGNGIDIVEHPDYNIWIPELIFGHLRTSTNYNKDEKKITGGKNGFGFKLVLIWSSWGKIETVDHKRGLKYIQEFKNNLDLIEKPQITKFKGKPYTKVSFKPDYERLKIDGLSNDMISLFQRRVYDIAAVTDKSVKVKYNNCQINVKSFEQYLNLYIGNKSESPRIYD
jgi:DNA topoisomerase-2